MGEKKTVEVKDPDLKPTGRRELMDVVLKGGPLTRGEDFEFTVDGVAPKYVTSAVLRADVNDAIRLHTEQTLVHADVHAKAASWEKLVVADVRVHGGDEPVKITGRGGSALEALKDAVAQLEGSA